MNRPGGRRVLVTGAGGLIGRGLVRALAERPGFEAVVAVDVRPPAATAQQPGIRYFTLDVCAPELRRLVAGEGIDTVVHLAAIVTPPPGCTREMQYAVDVGGTENVLGACLEGGVRKLIVSSSGAAYGYHFDNPPLLDENDPLRGNPEFAYSDHKRIVEERLAAARREHPGLAQLIFRLGTVLGETVRNQITALFEQRIVVGVAGAATPFNFIWDEDVVDCLRLGIESDRSGIYNLAGDGVMTLREIAAAVGGRYVALPAPLLAGALTILQSLGRTQYGPEQVAFLRYRPVMGNERLKSEFGYRPKVSTREAFARWLGSRGRARPG